MVRLVAIFAISVAFFVKAELPILITPEVINGSTQTCPSGESIDAARDRINVKIEDSLHDVDVQIPDTIPEAPCGSSGWTRVVYLNMSDPSQSCPPAWQLYRAPQRACGGGAGPRCAGVSYDHTTGAPYSQVCGRVIAFPQSTVQAFRGGQRTIDNYYVDGVSVTHGMPRQHIWTFAAGRYPLGNAAFKCPCDGGDGVIPPFVRNNYFCEGSLENIPGRDTASVIWDGIGCLPSSTCCLFNSPPWFNVALPAPTDDGIEVRICSGTTSVGGANAEDTPITLMEIFVK